MSAADVPNLLPTRMCGRCGVMPAEVTHACPPPEFSQGLTPAIAIPVGPPCPSCGRTDGTHGLGCAVLRDPQGWPILVPAAAPPGEPK
jgi:hypothetical protein